MTSTGHSRYVYIDNRHAVSSPHNQPHALMPSSARWWCNILFGTDDCITSLQFLCHLSSLHLHRHARTHTNTHTSSSTALTLPEQLSSFPPTALQSSPEKENGAPFETAPLLRQRSSILTVFFSPPLPVHLLCEGFSNRRVHFIGLERKHHHPSDTLKLHYFTHWVVLTWRWNVCERAAHRFRSKPVLWITKLT